MSLRCRDKFSFSAATANKKLIKTFHFSFSLELSTVPRVEIVDERGLKTVDKFYKTGSTIELKCVISKVPQPTSYVTWKHGLRTLNYDTTRGGIRYVGCDEAELLCLLTKHSHAKLSASVELLL